MDEQILKILRTQADNFISGQSLRHKLSISKAHLNRCIHQLQDEGYDIQVQPHLGYRLVALPDKLLASELSWQLKTKIIGQKIFSYDTVDSTNTVASSLAEQGIAEGAAIFAEAQRGGRGRFDRSWVSPRATGIYLSLILRPKISSAKAFAITLLAAVSCAEAIRKVCGLPALIRWPNDILVNNKKVCGILTEMQAQGNEVRFIILGIGINVHTPISKLPAAATSLCAQLADSKVLLSRMELARELLRQLDVHYSAFKNNDLGEIIATWQNLSCLSGKRVKVFFAHKTIEGLAQDIDEQGALIVHLDSGFKQHVLAGDVVKVR